jgi:hypothetical protein
MSEIKNGNINNEKFKNSEIEMFGEKARLAYRTRVKDENEKYERYKQYPNKNINDDKDDNDQHDNTDENDDQNGNNDGGYDDDSIYNESVTNVDNDHDNDYCNNDNSNNRKKEVGFDDDKNSMSDNKDIEDSDNNDNGNKDYNDDNNNDNDDINIDDIDDNKDNDGNDYDKDDLILKEYQKNIQSIYENINSPYVKKDVEIGHLKPSPPMILMNNDYDGDNDGNDDDDNTDEDCNDNDHNDDNDINHNSNDDYDNNSNDNGDNNDTISTNQIIDNDTNYKHIYNNNSNNDKNEMNTSTTSLTDSHRLKIIITKKSRNKNPLFFFTPKALTPETPIRALFNPNPKVIRISPSSFFSPNKGPFSSPRYYNDSNNDAYNYNDDGKNSKDTLTTDSELLSSPLLTIDNLKNNCSDDDGLSLSPLSPSSMPINDNHRKNNSNGDDNYYNDINNNMIKILLPSSRAMHDDSNVDVDDKDSKYNCHNDDTYIRSDDHNDIDESQVFNSPLGAEDAVSRVSELPDDRVDALDGPFDVDSNLIAGNDFSDIYDRDVISPIDVSQNENEKYMEKDDYGDDNAVNPASGYSNIRISTTNTSTESLTTLGGQPLPSLPLIINHDSNVKKNDNRVENYDYCNDENDNGYSYDNIYDRNKQNKDNNQITDDDEAILDPNHDNDGDNNDGVKYVNDSHIKNPDRVQYEVDSLHSNTNDVDNNDNNLTSDTRTSETRISDDVNTDGREEGPVTLFSPKTTWWKSCSNNEEVVGSDDESNGLLDGDVWRDVWQAGSPGEGNLNRCIYINTYIYINKYYNDDKGFHRNVSLA